MNYEIRKVNINNIDDYTRVNIQAWCESYKDIIDPDFIKELREKVDFYIEKNKEKILNNEGSKDKYVLYYNNEPVGISTICHSRLEDYPNSGELGSIYFLDKVKGMGLGKILFEFQVDNLRKLGYKDMIIGCLKDNLHANGFYKHMGAKLVKERTITIGKQDLPENIYYMEI